MLVAALLLQIGHVPCAAQEPVMLQGDEIAPQKRVTFAPGLRIRITAPSIAEHRFTGALVKMGVDSLVLTREDFRSLAVPLASLIKLEANPGRKSKAILGAVVGLLAGVTTSVLLVDLSETVTYTQQVRAFIFSPSMVTQTITEKRVSKSGLITLVTAAFTSAVIGGAIGSKFAEWKQVPLPVRIGLTPQRQGGLALSTSFSF